ncbi:MAG: fasciclin domain-containing protein [Chthoniobacterales bacterium]
MKTNKLKKSIFAASTLSVVAGLAFSGQALADADATTPEVTKIAEAAATEGTVVEVLAGNPDFSTLVAAVKAADLAETLSGEGPFTIFAPTNEAFEKVPAETLETLMSPEGKDQLTSILTYHVVPSKVMAADVKTMKAPTVEGTEADVVVTDGNVTIDDAKVTDTDMVASNGVVHVIDTVLMP